MPSVSRISQRSLQEHTLANLQRGLGRLSKLQEKMSSGKEVGRPSDSPTGAAAALRFRAELRRSEQLKRNADDGLLWLGAADRAITDGLGVLGRVRELTLSGINGSHSDSDRNAIAQEIRGLRENLLGVANTTVLGRPLFAGTADVPAAYDANGVYQGDAGMAQRTVATGVTVRVDTDGQAVFAPGGTNIFDVLEAIADHFEGPGDQVANGLSADLGSLDDVMTRMRSELSGVGVRYKQVETIRDRVDALSLDQQNGLAEVESIDLPATIVELQLQEVGYQAALSASARVLQPSLVDFLR
jgi:flagellar hook-associated protein 3 FlgL